MRQKFLKRKSQPRMQSPKDCPLASKVLVQAGWFVNTEEQNFRDIKRTSELVILPRNESSRSGAMLPSFCNLRPTLVSTTVKPQPVSTVIRRLFPLISPYKYRWFA